jgi:thioredoxin-dependent peroxiredoxin
MVGIMAKIPAFALPGTDGQTWSSKELKGSAYVLYFYPRDSTPGCTTEACDFRDNMARLKKAGVQVFGVSPDSLASHEKFIAKQSLSFVLLSDEGHAYAEKLKVWGEKMMYGKKVNGIIRSTFLIDAEGNIAREWRGVRVKGHVDEVLAAVKELL